MLIGKTIGTIWATRKYESLHGYKMQLLQPINANFDELGDPIIALDTVGAGPNEFVIYVTASEAVIPLDVDMAPVDATIVAIIDSLNIENINNK